MLADTFESTLKEQNFQNSPVDRYIHILGLGDISKNSSVVLCVGDLVISTINMNTMNSFKEYLMHTFQFVDLKELNLFIGIRVPGENSVIKLDQNIYVN